jgi:hypothetical protein
MHIVKRYIIAKERSVDQSARGVDRVRGCARWVWRGYLGTVTVGFFSDGQTLFCTRPKVYLRNSSVSTFIY